MEEQIDALLVQALQAESESNERARRPRAHRQPRPPGQPPPREPIALTSDDLLPGFFALAFAMISQAELDLAHTCWRGGCKGSNDCARRKLSARHFLRELRAGRVPLWSDWVHLAEARVR
jgi:hypothetical protein